MKTTTERHAPPPWKVSRINGLIIYDTNGYFVAEVYTPNNARVIINTINNYEALLRVAKRVLKAYLRLPVGPDLEAIVMPEIEDLEQVVIQAEERKSL